LRFSYIIHNLNDLDNSDMHFFLFQISRFASSFRLEVFDWNQVGSGMPLGTNFGFLCVIIFRSDSSC
jgi:hypothetical protein